MRSTLGFPTRGSKSSSTCISTHSLWFIYFRNLLLSPTNSTNTTCLSQRFFSTRSNLQTSTHEQRAFQLWLLSGLEYQTSYLFRPSFSHRHFRSRAKPLYATHSSVATKVISNNNSNSSNGNNDNIDSVTISQLNHQQQQSSSSSLMHQSNLIHPRWISKIKDRNIDVFLQQLKDSQPHLDDKFIFKLLRSRLYNANQYNSDEAWKIYLTMKDLNVIDHMRSNHYGHLLNIIKYSSDATHQLLSILNQMESAKNTGLITISELHYSQVIYGLARQGSVIEICDLFDELKTGSLSISTSSISDNNIEDKKKILPVSFYTSLAVAAKKKNDISATTRAADIIEEAMKSGVLMEMEACAIMVSALSTNMESTVKFLTVMDQIGMMTKYTNNNNNNNNNINNVNDTQHHINNSNINNTNNHNHITTTNNNNNNNNNNKMNNLNVHIYTSLISGLAHNGDAINARRLWKEMRNHGLRPTTATYTAMVEAFARSGNFKAAIQMLKKYTYEHNGNLNKVMATSVLSNTIRHGRLDLARSLVKKWTDELGLKIENMDDEFKTAIMWVKVIDDVNQGLSFFNTLYEKNQEYVNSIMVNHLVKKYGDLQDKTGVTESYSLHELVNENSNANKIPASKSVDPDFYLVDALFKCRDVPAALSIFVKMRQRGLPDDITLAMVIRGLVMNDEGAAAWKLFRIIKIYGLEPNLHAYTSILKSCVPKSGKGSAHQQSLKDELSPEFLTHIFNISNSIQHHHPSLEVENKLTPIQAYILFRKMTGIQKPNVYTYTALISCFAKSNIGRAVDIFKYMCHDGVEPTVETYIALLQGCAIYRNGRMALMVYQHLRENQHHLQPNDKVWHYLLKALVRSRVDKKEIDKLASAIRGDGYKKKERKAK
ncbi:unnamed protein product [Cunninghamella blakesleeana]